MEEALKNDIHIETSSAFDINLIESLYEQKIVDKDLYVICNGYKKQQYIENIANLMNSGWKTPFHIGQHARNRSPGQDGGKECKSDTHCCRRRTEI